MKFDKTLSSGERATFIASQKTVLGLGQLSRFFLFVALFVDFPEGSSVAGVKVMLVVSVRLSDTKRSSTVHNVTGASNVAR